ncbi:MAG: hypothetical protein OXU50_00505 [Gammaproteobacteria bacterium]|nr:hypothetical protein [Gammaproteobacteria bacterium]
MMTTQKKKPLPGQHRKVGPLTEKVEPIMAPHPQLEVLQERMNHLATREQMNNLRGEAMGRMDKLHGEAMEKISHMATRDEMYKLHGEAMTRMDELHSTAMERMDVLQERVNQTAATVEVLRERTSHMPTRAEMHKLHGEAMERIGRVEGDLTVIKWTLSVFVAPLIIAMAAGILKLVFFP